MLWSAPTLPPPSDLVDDSTRVRLVPFRAMPATTSPQRILVIGAGYVGLVTAVGFASMGHEVDVVERWPERYDALVAGRVPIFEAGLQEAFDAATAAGCLRVLSKPEG